MNETEALHHFSRRNDDSARQGFERLCTEARPLLHRFLLRKGWQNTADREDIVQDTFVNLYRRRDQFVDFGVAAWRGYLFRAAQWSAENLRRDNRPSATHLPLEDWDRESESSGETNRPVPLPTADAVIADLSQSVLSGAFSEIADRILLGLDPNLHPRTHIRRLLAAQLFYLDDEPWQRILRLLAKDTPPGEPPLSRELLDEWLCDPSVLRHLAFRAVYHDADRLTAALLDFEPEYTESLANGLDKLARTALNAAKCDPQKPSGFGQWTWGECVVLLWRYRNTLTVEQIALRDDCPVEHDKLSALFERSVAAFPFNQQMREIIRKVGSVIGETAIKEALGGRELWYRLAFQYRYFDDLPHRDIQARMQPAADTVGFDVTAARLNIWLSGGRLIERMRSPLAEMLAAHMEQEL